MRLRVRQLHLSRAARPLRRPRRAARAVPRAGPRARVAGVAAADVPRRGAEPPGCGRRLLPAVPAVRDEGRVAAGRAKCLAAGGHAVLPPVGIRPDSTAAATEEAREVANVCRYSPHDRAARGTARGVPL